MPHRSLTPETVFRPRPSADEPSAFSFGPAMKPLSEQDRYKLLIVEQAAKLALPIGHLADRIGVNRSRLHKVLRNGAALSDELRDSLFEALEIDPVRAVRRQNIRHNSRRRLAECGPRLGVDVRRRACGAASADIRWSVA